MRSNIMILVVLLIPVLSTAEPTKTPKYLMSENMSLMDWGIYQADKKIESFKDFNIFSIHYMGGSASYDWDENRIILLGMFQGAGTNEECTENLRKLKGAFANFTWDEKKQKDAAEGVLGGLFSHEAGYQSKDRPEDVGKQLNHITRIEAHIFTSQKDGTLKTTVKCKSTFKSSEISIIAN